jgi:diaminohydroxyphosphoribosylaminopyrimidine deaminase/5-amino-6-(5-phosphoribosylamino)uracil reductase
MIKADQHGFNVTLKLATSLDARIATKTGASQWITGPLARQEVHRMRASHDCIITGIGTVLADDPLLTARHSLHQGSQPLRVVLDTHARLPSSSKLANSLDQGKVVWFTGQGITRPSWTLSQAIAHHAVAALKSEPGGNGLDLAAALAILQTNYGVRSVMVEAGPKLATSFLAAGLVSTIAWFRAPILLGGDGRSVFESLGVTDLAQAWKLEKSDTQFFGPDVLETYTIMTE